LAQGKFPVNTAGRKQDLPGPFFYLNQSVRAKNLVEKAEARQRNRSAIYALRLLRFEICERRNDSDHVLSKN
jgi:hypothetical protein